MRYLISILFVTLAFTPSTFGWSLHDVSILLPLPELADNALLLNTQTQGQAGALLPANLLAAMPLLAQNVSFSQLRVLSIRLDPCFAATPAVPHECHAQIRMVWQPLAYVHGETVAYDAALHSFYEISPNEFKEILQKVKLLAMPYNNGAWANAPLGIHPVLAAQGFRGAFWREFKKIILGYSGGRRLSRLTFMTQIRANQIWTFGGVDVVHGDVQKIVIPRIGARLQSFFNKAGAHFNFDGGFKPAAIGQDTFDSIVLKSSDIEIANADLLRQSVTAIERIENPLLHNPQNVDCASCHVAQAARLWATEHFSELSLDHSLFKFGSNINLSNSSPNPNLTVNLRAFGYFGRKVAISQRTINESARVVERLNQFEHEN